MFPSIRAVFKDFFRSSHSVLDQDSIKQPPLQALGFNDFLNLDIPARELLLNPILPERSLSMLYAPRGVGKTLLALSIGLAIASGTQLLRWSAPRQRKVLYVDGEMPVVSLQERVRALSIGISVPNQDFRLLAADNIENGINLSDEEGQRALDPLLSDVDLLILDNLSTLCPNRSESASDAWMPVQGCAFRRSRPAIPSEAGRLYRLKPARDSDDPGHLGKGALASASSSGQLAGASSS